MALVTATGTATGQHHYHGTMMSSLRKTVKFIKRPSNNGGDGDDDGDCGCDAFSFQQQQQQQHGCTDTCAEAGAHKHNHTHPRLRTNICTHTHSHEPLVTCGIFCTLNSLTVQQCKKY